MTTVVRVLDLCGGGGDGGEGDDDGSTVFQ